MDKLELYLEQEYQYHWKVLHHLVRTCTNKLNDGIRLEQLFIKTNRKLVDILKESKSDES